MLVLTAGLVLEHELDTRKPVGLGFELQRVNMGRLLAEGQRENVVVRVCDVFAGISTKYCVPLLLPGW